jgi:predicted lipoprotein
MQILGVRAGLPVAGLASLVIGLAGCHGGHSAKGPEPDQVATAFVDAVVLPQVTRLVQGSEALSKALNALAADPTPAHLTAARAAWAALRQHWETGESWAFGPAESQGYDGNLDDWPVNTKDLGTALSGPSLTAKSFAQLTTTARGLHGIEAVLFGAGLNKVSALTPQQGAYLRAAGQDLVVQSRGLLQAWQGPKGFGATLVGGSGQTQAADKAVNEMLQGMVGTLEELAAEKLGKPLSTRNTSDLESFYSDTTQADVVANLSGVEQVWTRTRLQQLIAARDASLARSIDQALAGALVSARALPPQLNGQLTTKEGRQAIAAVVADCERTAKLLQQVLEDRA